MNNQISELLLKLELIKVYEPQTHEQASQKFLQIESIEDELYELGYIVED